MTTRGLLKLAKDTDQHPWGDAALATGGAASLAASRDRLLGRKTLFHGTSADNADAIRREGFRLSDGFGGASEAVGTNEYVENSKGKVHLTPRRSIANGFGALASDDELRGMGRESIRLGGEIDESNRLLPNMRGSEAFDHIRARFDLEDRRDALARQIKDRTADRVLEGIRNPFDRPGETLRLSVPYGDYRMMEPDPDMMVGDRDWMGRQLAVRTDTPPDSKYIRGAIDDLGRTGRLKESLRLLPGYVRSHPGRFATGAGLASAGLAGMGLAAHNQFDE